AVLACILPAASAALAAPPTGSAAEQDRSVRLGPWQPDVIVQPPRHEPRTTAIASVSHLIYLNDCRAHGGCTVSPGYDDSRTHHSSIPNSTVVLSAWGWGDAQWASLVQCVKDTYAPFDV